VIRSLKGKLGALRTTLTHAGEEQPLHRAALAVVILLDLFILISIFDGLDVHTRQLTSPSERVPELCREIAIDGAWTPARRLDRLAAEVSSRLSGFAHAVGRREQALHPACARVLEPIDAVAVSEELARAFEGRGRLQGDLREVEAELSRTKGAYDTQLLETIAGRRAAGPDVEAIQASVHERTLALEAARAQLAALDARLDRAPPVVAVWARVDAIGEAERSGLAADLRRLERWYPVKRLGMQLLFLLPLVAAFYAWSSASVRRRRGLQALVATHLLVIASIPVLFRVAEAVYEIVPKKLLARLFALLESLNLVALWHYLVMALAVAFALGLVVVVQRKLFSRERLIERRIARGLCQDCGKLLPRAARACPFCGFGQYRPCARCSGATHVHARFCKECGAAAAS
jgi:hypothetical protein